MLVGVLQHFYDILHLNLCPGVICIYIFSVILRDNDPTNPFSQTTILLSIKRILNLNPPPPPQKKIILIYMILMHFNLLLFWFNII